MKRILYILLLMAFSVRADDTWSRTGDVWNRLGTDNWVRDTVDAFKGGSYDGCATSTTIDLQVQL